MATNKTIKDLEEQFILKLNTHQQNVGKLKSLKNEVKNKDKEKEDLLKQIENTVVARDLLEKSSKYARERGREILEKTVSEIVQIVFGKKYEVVIDLKVKGGTPTADVYLKKKIGFNQELIDLNHDGGGLKEIISISFFVAVSRIVGSENKAIVVMDEPTAAVSSGYSQETAEAISILTKYLEKNSLVITHEREYLPNLVDKVYLVKQGSDAVSTIEEV